MDREPPYTINRAEIEPNPARVADDLYITFFVTQHRADLCGPGFVYREFKEKSGKLHVYDPILRGREVIIENGKFTRISQLPSNITVGPTIYRGRACYFCNSLQRVLRWPICVPTPETKFTVID